MSWCLYVGNFVWYKNDFSELVLLNWTHYDGQSEELILTHWSKYDTLLNFPWNLKKYSQIKFSKNICLNWNEWVLIKLRDFSYQDQLLLWINLVSIIIIIWIWAYTAYKIFIK